MNRGFSSYPDWKAPGEDSALLIWPEPKRLVEQTLQNHHSLGSEATVRAGGVPLNELRREMRQWLHIQPDRPLMLTAHQTELYHAGVWSKLALAAAAGKSAGAESLMIAVDSDAPKHLQLRWPRWAMPITDDPRMTSAAWSGLLAAPTPGHLRQLTAALSEAAGDWPFKPMAGEFLADLYRRAIDPPPLSIEITEAMQQLDSELGLDHESIVASPIYGSPPYLALVSHLLCRAADFAQIYNQALADYRVAHRIRTKARPMPDLQLLSGSIEVPFWLDDLRTGTRSRPYVKRDAEGWKLLVHGEPIRLGCDSTGWPAAEQLQKFLQTRGARLSPRALTLTLVLRLLVADQFIHGIGGGRYDQVTDQVIRKFFNMEPPAFAVTTATLYFPTAVGRPRPCLPCLAHEGHQLRHRVLGEAKLELVSQIDQSPRKSPQRLRAFLDLHGRLADAARENPHIRNWQHRVDEANRLNLEDSPLFDREFFYAIQPRDRLMKIIQRYGEAFA
jgi:hypothetical protein